MQVFVTLNPDNTVCASTELQYDDDGKIVMMDGYEGPYDVPDVFREEQHLFRLVKGKLIVDKARAGRLRVEAMEISARNRRDERLSASDYLVMPDYPLDDKRRGAVKTYRQALRDVTKQKGWPEDINWPEIPE